jgi:hypothetical protein
MVIPAETEGPAIKPYSQPLQSIQSILKQFIYAYASQKATSCKVFKAKLHMVSPNDYATSSKYLMFLDLRFRAILSKGFKLRSSSYEFSMLVVVIMITDHNCDNFTRHRRNTILRRMRPKVVGMKTFRRTDENDYTYYYPIYFDKFIIIVVKCQIVSLYPEFSFTIRKGKQNQDPG